jgi:hypothetical protein
MAHQGRTDKISPRPHSAITPVVAIGLTAPALALTDLPLEQTRASFNGNSATASAIWHIFLAPRLGRNPRSILMSCVGLSYPTNGVAMAMQRLRDERAPIATNY